MWEFFNSRELPDLSKNILCQLIFIYPSGQAVGTSEIQVKSGSLTFKSNNDWMMGDKIRNLEQGLSSRSKHEFFPASVGPDGKAIGRTGIQSNFLRKKILG